MDAVPNIDRSELKTKAVLSNADHLSSFLIFCVGLLATIIVLKFQRVAEFEIGNLKIGTDQTWVAVAILSIAHQIAANYFVRSIDSFCDERSYAECRHLFKEITVAGPLLFRGLVPRGPLHPNSKIYVLSAKDPTTWWYYSFAGLIPVACIPFYKTPDLNWISIAIALYLLIWNWGIGSFWALSISALGTRNPQSQEISPRPQLPVKGPVVDSEELIKGIGTAFAILFFHLIGLALLLIYLYIK